MNKFIIQTLKFMATSTFGASINLSALYLITEYLGVYYIISAILSWIIALTICFFVVKLWVFKEHIKHKILEKYLKFASIGLFALAVNITFLYIFTEFIGIYYLVSQIMSGIIAFSINFLINRCWTFKKR